MKPALLLAVLTAVLCGRALPAHAIASCGNNDGLVPRAGTELPPHARLLAFSDDSDGGGGPTYVARIDGKVVPLKSKRLASAPYQMELLEVDSDRTGTLTISGRWGTSESELAKYPVRAGAKMPKDVQGTTSRFTANIPHTTVKEKFDGLAISVGDATPAILAHVRIRRDAQSPWQELDMPVHSKDRIARRTAVLLGELGCTQNSSVALLERGVDLEVTVTLVDGTTRKVALPSRVKLTK
jgi:hypothetical protein